MVAENLSHYRVLKKLGAGKVGEVYLTQDTTLGRTVALKEYSQKAFRFLKRQASPLRSILLFVLHSREL